MSAGTASAAVLDHPLREDVDNPVDAPRLPGQRNVLRSVPASGKPDGRGPEDPLRLGRAMRLRLRAAVQALLADPSIAGLKDAPKLGAVVLFAKSRAPKGAPNDNQTSIWVAELGRWLGVSESAVHRNVLFPLRTSDGLHTKVVTDAKGHPTGLDCLVMPLWRARKSGGAAHPLALTKAELATLLRLIEALFGPGWAPEGREPTPPGLLAGRRGRGAATDRLGLLLMVLNTRASGWLQLCGGSVKKREGRGAATLARLLGCSPSGARKVLARLTEAGVVARQRRDTKTRMNGRGRVMLLPVAHAYGRALASGEAVSGSGAVFSQRPGGAVGDHAPAGAAGALGTSGMCGAEGAEEAVDQERPGGAELHADHASMATPVVPLQLSCGFSGEGRGGGGRRPERARVREDQLPDEPDGAPLQAADGEGGPLRGDKPNRLLAHLPQQHEKPPAVAGRASAEDSSEQDGACVPRAGSGLGCGSGARGRVPRPRGGLEAVLEPVWVLWDRLGRSGARRVVEQAVRRELRYAAAVVGPERAAGVLAERLSRRLAAQPGGPEAVTDPVGWLRGRGLPRSSSCADARCDEGTLMTTGAVCERCAELRAERRRRRARVAEQVRAELPDADFQARRLAVEQRLREVVAADLVRDEERRRQAAEAEAARTAAAQRARAEAETADQACRARPCRQCGAAEAGGLCGVCRARDEAEALLRQAVAAAVAGCGCPVDSDAAARLAADAEAAMRIRVQHAYDQTRKGGGNEVTAAVTGRLAAESLLHEHRQSALGELGHGSMAEAEADQARAAQRRRRHLHPTAEAAEQAAEAAAREARQRTAEHLLAARSTAWLAAQAPAPAEEKALRGRAAVYAAGAAKVRAALAT